MPLLLRRIISAQLCVVVAIVVLFALAEVTMIESDATLWWLVEPLLAWLVAVLYVATGMLLVQDRIKPGMLVVRHVFRTLVCGLLLVLVPLLIIDRVSVVTIGSFLLIHSLSWQWVFGRRSASTRLLLPSRTTTD